MSLRVADQQSSDPTRREPTLDQTRDDIFVVRWLHAHALINFFRSMCRPLVKGDLFNLTSDLHPECNVRKYRESRTMDQAISLSNLLFRRILLWEFIAAGVLAMIAAGLAFAGPLVIKEIMSFLKIRSPTADQQSAAYGYAGLWIGLYLLRIFVNEYADRLMFLQAVKAEQILAVEVHHKITRLSLSYRATLEKGDLMCYLTTDIKLVFNFIRSTATLFSAPTTLIVVQAFLFKEVGLLGFTLLGILIIVAGIQVLLNYKLSQARKKKLATLDDRMNFNLEVFGSVREVKTLGWEDLIINKNREFRQKENEANQTYYTLANIYDLVINLSPTLTVFIIFLVSLLVSSSSQLDTAKIYTVLSFVGMTYSPTKSLLNIIVAALDGTASLAKISTFLKAEEIQQGSNEDKSLKLGEILVRQFFEGSWQVKSPTVRDFGLEEELSNTNLKTKPSNDRAISETPFTAAPQFERKESERYTLRIPNSLHLQPGDKYVVIGESDGGKSTLLHAIMGNLNKVQGDLRYRGKVGYLPQKLWFRKASVKQNVLFGMPFVKEKLKKIYRIVMLANELPLLTKGEDTIIKDLSSITDSQKRRIALARVLYSQPDIMLLDSVFASIDPETASDIYSNLCQQYTNKTIVLTTHNMELLKPSNNIIIMKDGRVEQIGKYGQLLANKESSIHKILEKQEEIAQSQEDIWQKQIENEQKIARDKRAAVRKRKIRTLVKHLVQMSRSLTKQQLEQEIIKPAQEAASRKEEKAAQPKRIDGVPGGMYLNFFKSASVMLYLALFFLSMVTQGTKVFSDWWIGSLKTLPWKLTDANALYIYIGLTVAYGLFFALGGFISPCVSVANTESLADGLCTSLANTQMSWFEGQNTLKVAGRVNRDNEQIFGLNSLIQNIFKNVLLFAATVVLVGVNAPTFFALAGGVIVLDILILFFYMRQEREVSAFNAELNDPLTSGYDEAIQGTDILRAFGKLEECRQNIFKSVYLMEVYKVNYKYIGHGMSMLAEFTSLMVIAGAAFFAVSSNTSSVTKDDIAIIGTSISFSLKLTGIMVSIIKDSISLEIGIKAAVVRVYLTQQKSYDVIGKNQETDYSEPAPPQGWPANNSITFENATLRFDGYENPVVQSVSFEVQSGENVVICGKGGKAALLLGSCKQLVPVPDKAAVKGTIRLSGVDLQNIGRKHVSKKAMMITEFPFLFTGTVRENMDPRRGKSDDEIRQALIDIGVWDELPLDQAPAGAMPTLQNIGQQTTSKLDHVLIDAGSQLALGLQQKMSLARALLYRPSVLLLDNCTSSLDERTESDIEKLMRDKLRETTILSTAAQMDTAVEADRILYMTLGVLREMGNPMELLKNPHSKFSRMVQSSNPELYQRVAAQAKKGVSSLKKTSKMVV